MPPPPAIHPPTVPPLANNPPSSEELLLTHQDKDLADQQTEELRGDQLFRTHRQPEQVYLERKEQRQRPVQLSQDEEQEQEQRIPYISHTVEHDTNFIGEPIALVGQDESLPDAADWARLEELMRDSFNHQDHDSKQQTQQQQELEDQEHNYATTPIFTQTAKAVPYPFLTFAPRPPLPSPSIRPAAGDYPSSIFSLANDPDQQYPPEEGNDEDDDLSWLIFSIAITVLLISCVSLLRSCSQKPWFASVMGAEYSTLHGAGVHGSSGAGGHYRGGAAGSGPLQVAADDEANQELSPEELEAHLAEMTDAERQSFEAARAFQVANPPCSVPTDISLSQYLSIQEKGVSAWEFEPSYDHRLLVHDRTELSFFDREACVQTNLPLPKQQEVYYWEVKMFEKSPNTTVAVGVSTKPYPTMRLPGKRDIIRLTCPSGWNRHSVAYFSNGLKYYNTPWSGMSYGPLMYEGDVVGCGYRPRTGTIFFTRNGKRLEDAYTGLRYNLFPTVGATGPCVLHINFGQSGFVFVEANVKKWGLAPATGSLVPPPAYGSERGSILLEAGNSGLPAPSRIRPPLRTSQSRARVQAAGILVQIDGTDGDHHSERSGGGSGNGVGNGRYGTPPVDISLSDISAPPPKYSSVDQHTGSQSHLAAAAAAGAATVVGGTSNLSNGGGIASSMGGMSRGRSGSRTSRTTVTTATTATTSDSDSEEDNVTLLVDARPTTVA